MYHYQLGMGTRRFGPFGMEVEYPEPKTAPPFETAEGWGTPRRVVQAAVPPEGWYHPGCVGLNNWANNAKDGPPAEEPKERK